jgi:hypothetical protein
MAPGGSNSSFSLTIGAIQTIVLLNSGGAYHGYSANAATIGASKIEGGGNLANSTWYYVYAYDNAGTVDYLLSTTAPRASRQYRNSVDGSQYRYLGCFVTNPSGAPLPFRTRTPSHAPGPSLDPASSFISISFKYNNFFALHFLEQEYSVSNINHYT